MAHHIFTELSHRVALIVLQLFYLVRSVVNGKKYDVAIGIHFLINGVLHALFLALFERLAFEWAEFVLVMQLINLCRLYFANRHMDSLSRISIACPPLAWVFVALYWNGAIIVKAIVGHNNVAETIGDFFIWSIAGFGLFFFILFKVCDTAPPIFRLTSWQDSAMSFFLSWLSCSIATAQHSIRQSTRSCIFAAWVTGVLMLLQLAKLAQYLRDKWPENSAKPAKLDAENEV